MVRETTKTNIPLSQALLGGLAAGGLAAMVTSLTSLALRSPDSVLCNPRSVTIGCLLGGLIAGTLWWLAMRRGRAHLLFTAFLVIGLVAIVVAAIVVEAAGVLPLPGLARYFVPLAIVATILLRLLTPVLCRLQFRPAWITGASVAIALVVGITLANLTSQTGRLSLPSANLSSAARTNAGQGSSGLLRPSDLAGAAFVVAPGESSATYTVNERLVGLSLPDDAIGHTTAVTGTIYLDGRPSHVVVDASKFTSDQPTRDHSILTRGPNLNQYPLAEFTVPNLGDLPATYRPGDTITRTVQGTMTIRDVERPMTFAVQARMQGDVLYIVGKTDFTWDDFQMPKPTARTVISVDDTIHAEVLLVAKRST